jgi:hypothetical protein
MNQKLDSNLMIQLDVISLIHLNFNNIIISTFNEHNEFNEIIQYVTFNKIKI